MKMDYTEQERKLPVSYQVDVLVAGSGPAGIGAAIRAARMGMKTMVVDMQGCLGGIATAGMMSHWGGHSSSLLLKELLDRSITEFRGLGDVPRPEQRCTIHHERLKMLLLDMMKEANVQVLLYTFVCGVTMDGDGVTGVVVENKTGRSVILAKRVIDATGDGDIAAFAGVPYCLGREEDHLMQPCTMMFQVGGVEEDRAVFPGSFETLVETQKGELQALAKEQLPFPAGHVLLYRTTLPGVVCCNMTNCIGVDGTKAEDLTRAVQICTSQLEPIVTFLRTYAPGYEHCFLLDSAQLMGVRETRHFRGLKTLEKEDILEARYYEDWAVREAFFNFDVHNLTGASLDRTGVQKNWTQSGYYTIPYGCLVPQGVRNLLLSGRTISGGHLAHSNFRIMSVCMAIGEAAGAACAVSIADGVELDQISIRKLQASISGDI